MSSRRISFLSVLALAAAMAFPSGVPAQDELRYEVTITEVGDPELEAALQASSNLIALQDRPVSGIAGLRRRAESDLDRLRQALRSFGYYQGDVTLAIDASASARPGTEPAAPGAEGEAAEDAPVAVTLIVNPGEVYRFAEIALTSPDGGPSPIEIDRSALPIRPGDPARAALVLEAEERIIAEMQRQGHPFAAVPGREAVVDHATGEMFVTFSLDPGPVASFGEVGFKGLERVDEAFVRGRVPFIPGERYSPARLDELRNRLIDAGVFTSVRIDTAGSLTPEGQLPVTVSVVERPRRFVGFGANYATDVGFGANAYWGHRNLFGGAESLRIEGAVGRIGEAAGDVSEIDYRLSTQFRKPDFITTDQDFLADFTILAEHPDAYDREAILASLGIERQVTDRLTLGAGLSFELSRVARGGEDEDEFFLVGVPLRLAYDSTDNLFDPTRGMRLEVSLTPYPGWLGTGDGFTIGRVTASAYEDFGTEGRAILAGRLSLGSTVGAGLDDLPPDKRFYAGGGGSVRGYDYQSIGPEDADGDPIGGRSLIEMSLELRYRITETIGIVPFIDAGSVYESSYPDFGEDLRVSAGIGARYYTGFGPIRVDVAMPLNKDEGDSAFGLYVSLGQSF